MILWFATAHEAELTKAGYSEKNGAPLRSVRNIERCTEVGQKKVWERRNASKRV